MTTATEDDACCEAIEQIGLKLGDGEVIRLGNYQSIVPVVNARSSGMV